MDVHGLVGDLGLRATASGHGLRVWSASASSMELRIFDAGDLDVVAHRRPMARDADDVWGVESDLLQPGVAYAIGVAHPVSLMVQTFGTGKLSDAAIGRLVSEHFDLRPAAFRDYLDLHRPIFQKTAAYGHFGREDPDFTWERTDRADALRAAAGLEVRAPA